MAYKNKTYVCFDADEDIKYYNLMKAWNENDNADINFHNAHDINNLRDESSEAQIKKKLKERLENTKVLVILIGEKTKNLYKYVRWEIEWAIENDIPIVAMNLNKSRMKDSLCPPILNYELSVFIPFGLKILDHALNHWPANHMELVKNDKSGPYYYPDTLYKGLDI